MSLFDAFRYDGKRAVVVGGATGIGAAVAHVVKDAGAEVVVMDRAAVLQPGVRAIRLDLAERASIDAAVDACGGPVHALFSCAGVADGTPGIERINFVGHRHLIDRMVAHDMLPRGSAICMISSVAGIGWEPILDRLSEVLDLTDFDAAARWFVDHGRANYMTTKQVIAAYVAREAFTFLKRGIRINAISPGATDTPLAQANKETWLGFGTDYRTAVGIKPFTPVEQAYPLVFLCSDAAAAVTGITITSDAGWLSSSITKSFAGGTFFAKVLLGRSIWTRLVRTLGQKMSTGAGAKFFNRRTFLKHEQ
ncbi:MAG TPA: SDR family oxidoreductase [Candidatus Limnocylindria bacterium]|nr:SDR family oxidoreductase [Candidatus Limnocylindria bacterium]